MNRLQTAGGGDITSVTVFFFGAAHTRHYKIPLNKVVGILNAKVLFHSGHVQMTSGFFWNFFTPSPLSVFGTYHSPSEARGMW